VQDEQPIRARFGVGPRGALAAPAIDTTSAQTFLVWKFAFEPTTVYRFATTSCSAETPIHMWFKTFLIQFFGSLVVHTAIAMSNACSECRDRHLHQIFLIRWVDFSNALSPIMREGHEGNFEDEISECSRKSKE
jgi:hypothetical protein